MHLVTDVARILADYESGLYTRIETECRLIDLAAERDPVQFMVEVPAKWADAIRLYEGVNSPPATVEEAAPVLRGSRSNEQTFKAFWAMHRYFCGEAN